jgi:serine protease
MNKLLNKTMLHKSIFLLFVVLLCFPFLSFKDRGEYKIIDGKVISRGHDKNYEVGIVNVKFKDQISVSNLDKFGINVLDAFLSDYSVTKVQQKFPLKSNVSKRKIGDEDLAKMYAIKFDKTADPLDIAQELMKRFPDILEWAEPSIVYRCDFTPNDPNVGSQWHISKINAYQAWDICTGDTSVVIGIVDSGTDFDHPDLEANFKRNWNENPTNGIDDDNNGYVDDYRGWDFYSLPGDNDPSIQPSGNTHGSHVSGCADQVTNNGVGGAGIGYKVKLLCTKHTDDTNPESYLYNTDNGLVYCYSNGAKVINCSFGSSYYSSSTQTIVNNAWANGTVICASAGNDGSNVVRYPASYDNVVSVAATTSTDAIADFSNYHSTVDISAPGYSILSTYYNNTYSTLSGTSMSSPIVAGTVALIRSKFPSLTPQQVVDRLKLGVDSIYDINPSYVGLLGTGRVNAFKCLSELPILRVTSYLHNDSIYGNNDKIYDVNEVIPIALNLKNTFIAGSNVSIRLTTSDTTIQIVQDSVYLGSVPAYGTTSTTFANTFKVKAKSSCSLDKTVTFTVSNSASCYMDNSYNTLTLTFRRGYVVHSVNNLKLALTSDGAVGKKAQSYGTGLYLGNENVNQIYESGLMIGISSTQVSDVSRRGTSPANISDTDFVALKNYTLTTPGTISAQDGSGQFNDDGAGTSKIGVLVTAASYAFTGASDSNYILLKYTIKNTNSSALSNLYAGLFTYFCPNGSFASNNKTRYNSTNKLGYTYDTTTPNPYLGVALMTNQSVNFKALPYTDIFNGFTTEEKWLTLSSGIYNDSLGPGGPVFTISAGPLSLAANESVVIGFAVVKGSSLSDLLTNTATAQSKYNSVGVKLISEELPKKYELMQNYPNPFNPETKIKFSIPKNDNVSVKIYDVLGREIMTLVNEKLVAGSYEFTFDGSRLSSGLYFYRMNSGSYSSVKRMILVK